jgi:serine/threonine protein kinase
MLIGVTPFFNKNKNVLLTKIKAAKVIFPDKNKYKIEYSDLVVDLIGKLLDKDKYARLGSTDDFAEILSHPFFADLNIEQLETKTMKPPFKPTVTNDLSKFFNV